jgi:hypothetical protein
MKIPKAESSTNHNPHVPPDRAKGTGTRRLGWKRQTPGASNHHLHAAGVGRWMFVDAVKNSLRGPNCLTRPPRTKRRSILPLAILACPTTCLVASGIRWQSARQAPGFPGAQVLLDPLPVFSSPAVQYGSRVRVPAVRVPTARRWSQTRSSTEDGDTGRYLRTEPESSLALAPAFRPPLVPPPPPPHPIRPQLPSPHIDRPTRSLASIACRVIALAFFVYYPSCPPSAEPWTCRSCRRILSFSVIFASLRQPLPP